MTLAQIQIACTGFIILWAVMLIAIERRVPYNPGQKLFRAGFFDDLFWYTIVQNYLLGLIISAFIQWIDTQSGISRFEIVTHWPIAAQVLLFLVTHDFYIYCFHRLQHHNKYLWRLHEAHHSVEDVDWLAGSRSHPLEILINQTVEFLPIVLLGAAPEVAMYKGVISACWGMYIHANVNVREGWLQYLFNGPEMHRWHHSNAPEAMNKNFATKIAVWDWIFGSAYLPRDKHASNYGLGGEDFPKGYFRQVAAAFRKM